MKSIRSFCLIAFIASASNLLANDYNAYREAASSTPAWQNGGSSVYNKLGAAHMPPRQPTDQIRAVPPDRWSDRPLQRIPINPDESPESRLINKFNPLVPVMEGIGTYSVTGDRTDIGKPLIDTIVKQGYGRIIPHLIGAATGTPIGFLGSQAIRRVFGAAYDKLVKDPLHKHLDGPVKSRPDFYDQQTMQNLMPPKAYRRWKSKQAGSTPTKRPYGPYLRAIDTLEQNALQPDPPSDERDTSVHKSPNVLKEFLDRRVEVALANEIRKRTEARHARDAIRKKQEIAKQEAEDQQIKEFRDREDADFVRGLLGTGLMILENVNRYNSYDDSGYSEPSGGGSRCSE